MKVLILVTTKSVSAYVKPDRSIPNAGLWVKVLKSEDLIKIKITLDVPLQSYANENCNINWKMNPFGNKLIFLASES